jgi:hypothetical protein
MFLRGVSLCVFLAGCCTRYETAECGDAPDEEIVGLSVQIGTGSDATDSDVELCVTAAGRTDCYALDQLLEDDFSKNSIDNFTIAVNIEPGTLEGFELKNRGDALADPDDPIGDVLLAGSDWTPTSIEINGTLGGGGSVMLYRETDMCDASMDAGDAYPLMDCGS